MAIKLRYTVDQVATLPDHLDDTRYELVDGDLYVSRQPSWEHQVTCTRLTIRLGGWNEGTGLGEVVAAPGVIFSRYDAAAPDIVWVSRERLPRLLRADRKLHAAPELIVEVLSPGEDNADRDLGIKLDMYSRYGVLEYWIPDWRDRTVQVYRHQDGRLQRVTTLTEDDTLTSPLLPGFSVRVGDLFPPPPADE